MLLSFSRFCFFYLALSSSLLTASDSYPYYLYELFGRLDHVGYREEVMQMPVDKSQFKEVNPEVDFSYVWNGGRAGWLAKYSPDQYYLAYSLDRYLFQLQNWRKIMEIPRIERHDDGRSEIFCVEILEQLQRIYSENGDVDIGSAFFEEASSEDVMRYLHGVYHVYGVRGYNVINVSQIDEARLNAILEPFCERIVILKGDGAASVKSLLFVPLDGFKDWLKSDYTNGFVFLETEKEISDWLENAPNRKRISELAFSSRVHLYEFSDVPAPDRLCRERILAELLRKAQAYLTDLKNVHEIEDWRNLKIVERVIQKGLSGEDISDVEIDELTKITYTDYVPKVKVDAFETAKNAVAQFRHAFASHNLEEIHEVYSVNSNMSKVEEKLNKEYAKFEVIDETGDFWFTKEIKMPTRGAKKYLFQGSLLADGGYYWTEDFYVYIFPDGSPDIHHYQLSPGRGISPNLNAKSQ